MLTFRDKYKANQFSQNGEDGIVAEVLRRLKIKTGVCVEFGATDGYYCSNTRALINQGWQAYMYERDIKKDTQGIIKAEITPENVNRILPDKCDLLSIDIDGNDFEVWRAYKGDAKIVIIEINSDYPPEVREYDKGTSYTPMVLLGIAKCYFLLCHTGNLIFIKREYLELFPEITGNPLTDFKDYFDYSWTKRN